MRLTAREHEVLTHLMNHPDARDREIADALGISIKTISIHLHHARRKLNVRSRCGLVVKALQLNLIGVPPPIREGIAYL